MSHHNHTNPSPSYDVPKMTIIEPPKTDHQEGEIPLQFSVPISRAQTAPVRREDSPQSSTSRGIRGIDAILGTAQDDVVGEYHNIEGKLTENLGNVLKFPRLRCLETYCCCFI